MGKRQQINNFNPYNRIKLNKFHQVQKKDEKSQSKTLRKKQRDLQRLLNYDKLAQNVKQIKEKQLVEVKEHLKQNKKNYQKHKRKQFFLQTKYSKIKMVQQKKIRRMIKKVRTIISQDPSNEQKIQEQNQLQKKLRYIKNFPKDLKYVSLFPNNQLSQQAKQFQSKIMQQIQSKSKKTERYRNSYKQQKKNINGSKIEKDNFFIVQKVGQEVQEQDL